MAAFDALDGGGVTIEELTGDRRKVTLLDRAMPFRQNGMRFEREHATNTEWLQGSKVATQQPQGPELKETQFSGTWHDRFIDTNGPAMATMSRAGGSAQPVSTARELALLFDDICDKGQVVRFVYLWIVRVGILKTFAFDPKTPNDVDWEMRFEWQSDGAGGRPSSVTPRDHGARAREVSGIVARLSDAADFQTSTAPLDPDALSEIGTAVTALASSAQGAEDQAFGLADGVLDPVESALGTAGALGQAIADAQSVAASIQGRTTRDWMATSSLAAQAGLDPQDVLATSVDLWNVTTTSRDAARAAARHRRALARQAEGRAQRIVRARQGDDLRSLLAREGVPAADWIEVATYNGLASSSLAAGQKVAIPVGQRVRR